MDNGLDETASLLLPIGTGGLFLALMQGEPKPPSSERSKKGVPIKLDASDAIRYLCDEYVALGAFRVATHAGSELDPGGRGSKPIIGSHFHTIDARRGTLQRTKVLLTPVQEEFKLPPAVLDPIVAPVCEGYEILQKEEDPERGNLLRDVMVVASFTYQLLLGIRYRHQISLPFESFVDAVARLRERVRSSHARTNLSFLLGLLRTYEVHPVGSLAVLPSTASAAQLEYFENMLDDEDFRQYSEWRYLLGIPQRLNVALRHLWVGCKKLARKRQVRRIADYTTRLVVASKGVHLPHDRLADVVRIESYIPPIVNMSSALRRAQRQWLADNPSYRHMVFAFKNAPQFEGWLLGNPSKATIRVKKAWFLGLYSFGGGGAPTDEEAKETLLRHFGSRLSRPVPCGIHLSPISFEDFQIKWGDDELEFEVDCCCEQHAKHAWTTMCSVGG